MKEITISTIINTVEKLCIDANYYIGKDVTDCMKANLEKEESPVGKEILSQILENNSLAAEKQIPMCQDTGVAVIFLEVGQEVHIVGGSLQEAIHEGVRRGYEKGYLRKSMVYDPIMERKNTKDNTPAIIYTDIVPGDTMKITIAPKGAGSENMSELRMMTPSDGMEGVIQFVVDKVKRASGNPCPPVVVGVGLGGNFEQSALLAKKALLRPLGSRHTEQKFADLERTLLEKINKLGIGPMGLGGRITALDVHIETMACHIASMPVAINIQCHASRHKTVIL
ncbi:MAG: fumarate hydratase [Caldisericia bacterium]|nr:fumarate hydratase [Caldisericia bacterium]